MNRNEIAPQLAATAPGQAHAQAVGAPATVNDKPAEQILARAQAAAHAQRRPTETNGICADMLVASPDNSDTHALQGITAAAAVDPEVAIATLRRAIKRRPANAVWSAHFGAPCRVTHPARVARWRRQLEPTGGA